MTGSPDSSYAASAPSSGPTSGGRGDPWLTNLRLRLARLRRHPWWVAAGGALAEVLLAIVLSLVNHHDILGVTGAEAILVGLVVAILAGPWAGLATTTVGAVAFWVFISDTGETAPAAASIVAAVLWGVATVAAGVIADALRREAAARRRADEEGAALHRRLERALLPIVPSSIGGCKVTTLYRPGEERLGLGGDFYDLQVLDDGGLALVIGDVSGHGPHSAALGASLRAAWRGLVQAGVDAPALLPALARVSASEAAAEDLYATVWLGWIDASGRRLLMGSMGHPAPLLLNGEVRYLESSPVPPLGVVPHPEWLPTDVELPEAWTLVLYTDGLVEGRASPGSPERFGAERLQAWFARRGDAVPVDAAALQALISVLEEANGGALPDDVAVLALKRSPQAP
ncbi:MAG TPA: PP2C family protein-serine/threonine phosphatase [Thermoleophilia bacterium]